MKILLKEIFKSTYVYDKLQKVDLTSPEFLASRIKIFIGNYPYKIWESTDLEICSVHMKIAH